MSTTMLKHCPLCSRSPVWHCESGKPVLGCPVCYWRNWGNPTPVAAAFITEGNYVVLVKRKDGSWCFPVGYVDPDESPGEAARREAKEESSLEITVPELPLRIFTIRGDNQHIMVFKAKSFRGQIGHADDAEGAGWFDYRVLPRMSYESDLEVIAEWYGTQTWWHQVRSRVARWIAPHLFRYS
jgi:ADP-ribose pyrophosphatase YjhB (NUDIX family)